jgi:hypothetical protein
MTTVPGTPNLQLHPFASSEALDFYWTLPTNQGDSAVNTYTLRCASIPFSTIVSAPNTHAKVSNLTNGQDYAFEIAATNVNGTGRYIPFQVSQPGVIPGGPMNFEYSNVGSDSVDLSWTFSTNVNEGDNRNFAIQVVPGDPAISSYYVSLYNSQFSTTITGLASASYTFNLHSINDAGWSLASAVNVDLGFA